MLEVEERSLSTVCFCDVPKAQSAKYKNKSFQSDNSLELVQARKSLHSHQTLTRLSQSSRVLLVLVVLLSLVLLLLWLPFGHVFRVQSGGQFCLLV